MKTIEGRVGKASEASHKTPAPGPRPMAPLSQPLFFGRSQ